MTFENMTGETYVRARAEQLAMQANLGTFQTLYLARGINFGSEVGEVAREKYDAFLAPYREQATKQFTAAAKAAHEAALKAQSETIEKMLATTSLTGTHDAAELTEDELEALKHFEV